MAQTSYAYAAARVAVMQTRMLTGERLNSMLQAPNAQEAFRLLAEALPGAAQMTDPGGYERLLGDQLRAAYEEARAMAPGEVAVEVLSAKYDFYNLKALLKARYAGKDGAELLIRAGMTPVEALQEAVSTGDGRMLPAALASAMAEAEALFALSPNPQALDILFDRAWVADGFARIGKRGNDTIRQYLTDLVDMKNIATVLRIRRSGAASEQLGRILLPGGAVDLQTLSEGLGAVLSEWTGRFAAYGWSEPVREGVAAFERTGSIAALERLCENYLLDVFRRKRYELTTVEPIIGYLLGQESQIAAIRAVMVAQLNGLDRETLGERLRELYV
ncbi:MAG: V-type ATPase subunit [Christensenellales bacterium]